MRTGFNPNRRIELPEAPIFVASVITHLPHLEEYHSQRLEIVKLSLMSMRENADLNPHIVVWDNGSCDELTDWLITDYGPDTLILSPNVGKFSARAGIFRMFPPETIIASADDDMYYYPGWDTAQLGILHTYPNVGCVTGYPVRTQFKWGIDSNISWANYGGLYVAGVKWPSKEGLKVERGKLIPDEYERDFALSIGRDPDWHTNFTETAQPVEDIKFTYQDVEAYATSHHCQFLGIAGILAPLTSFVNQGTTDERKGWDHLIDDAGYLRLSTVKRYTRHMGNILEPDLRLLAEEQGLLERSLVGV